MKRCPACGRTFTNNSLTDCLNDGTPLVEDDPASSEALPFAYPEEASRDYSQDVSFADFEETPPASTETPAPGVPLPYFAAPPVMQGTPPPYFAAQARRKGAQWPSLILLGVLGLFLTGLGLLIRHDLQRAALSQESVPVPVPSVATDKMPDLFPGLKFDDTLTEAADGTLRQSLITAVQDADAAEAQSFRTLDAAPLHRFYAGDALAVELDELKALKKSGTAKENHLVSQKFQAFQVNPEHTKAEVDEIETWSMITRSAASGKAAHKNPPEATPQIVSLMHTAQGWKVENVQFYKLQ